MRERNEITKKSRHKEGKKKKIKKKKKGHLFGEVVKEDELVASDVDSDHEQNSVTSIDTYNSFLTDDDNAPLTFDEKNNDTAAIIQMSVTRSEEEEEEEMARKNPLVPRSIIRAKLKKLNKFILGHTGRKIMMAWNLIDGRFQKSSHIKVEMIKEAGGLVIPVKKKAMTINSLTPILCSSKVGVIASELAFIYETFGISRYEALMSRKIAVLKTLLGPDKGKGIRQAPQLLDELQILMQQIVTEKLISVDELKELAFPADPEARAEAFKRLEIERQEIVNKMLEDKKKEEVIKTQALLRKAKIISDFDAILKEIQFTRGPLTPAKHSLFKSVLEFCVDLVSSSKKEKDLEIPFELPALLGLDAFPKFLIAYMEEKEKERDQSYHNREQSKKSDDTGQQVQRLGYEGAFRIKLQGPPTVVTVLKNCVALCKGLSGVSYRDVVEMLQSYSSTRAQAFYRGYRVRWKYQYARKMWTIKNTNLKVKIHRCWAKYVRNRCDLRNFCWRPLKAWKFYLKLRKKRREFFRATFWTFYTWQRWSMSNKTAREKCKFLVGRVLPVYRQLTTFRAWKHWTQEKNEIKRRGELFFYEKSVKPSMLKSLRWFARWAKRRKILRRRWFKEGLLQVKKREYECKNYPFQLWHTFVVYKIKVRLRANQYAGQYRNMIYRNVSPRTAATPGYRRKRAKAIIAAEKRAAKQKQIEDEKNNPQPPVFGAPTDESEGATDDDNVSRDSKRKKKKKKDKKKDSKDPSIVARVSHILWRPYFSWTIKRNPLKVKGPKTSVEEIPGAFPRLLIKGDYEIGSDNEDLDDLPKVLTKQYSKFEKLSQPKEEEFLWYADKFAIQKATKTWKMYRFTENWAFIEAAMRFHRYGKRCFQNLRDYAQVKRNTRLSQRAYALRRMRVVFGGLLAWLTRDANDPGQSEAERIKNELRSIRLAKMLRRRQTMKEIKENMPRQDSDDELDERPRSTQASRRAARRRSMLGQGEEKQEKQWKPPNLLEWDDTDRETELNLMKRMMDLCDKMHSLASVSVVDADKVSASLVKFEGKRDALVEHVLKLEDDITESAVKAEEEYVSKFKLHAAGILVDVLAKVHGEVVSLLVKLESKKYFRALRMPILRRKALAMFNRKKIINWIRICRRLGSLYAKMDFYRTKRAKWIIFNRWLKYLEKRALDATPGSVTRLKRRCALHPQFSILLGARGFKKMVYHNNRRLEKESADLSAIYHRWVMLVQEEKIFREMEEIAKKRHNWAILHKIFTSLKTCMSTKETVTLRKMERPFILDRFSCDLENISKYFIAHRRRDLALTIGKYNRKFNFYQMKDGKSALNFKNFLKDFKEESQLRATTEQRILSESFETRGTQVFKDVTAPLMSENKLPSIMSRFDGRHFYDPLPEQLLSPAGGQTSLPGGFKLSKLRIALQNHMGVIGWQVVWSGDSCERDMEGAKRGKWNGAAITIHEIMIPKEDFVMGVEYMYEGAMMMALRLKLFFGGWTKTVGQKSSLSTLSIYLGEDIAEHQAFEDDYKYAGNDEQYHPAMPRSYVIGFSGIESVTRCTCMGLIVRKIKEQHIFSYYWVNDNVQRMLALSVNEKESIHLDANTLPSFVNLEGKLDTTKGESLTLPSGLGGSSILPSIDSKASRQGGSAASSISGLKEIESVHSSEVTRDSHVSKGHQLTKSEEQFFDVVRMRMTEVQVAAKRVENFARHMWNSKDLRNHPELKILVDVNIIAPLTKWYFNGINRRLVRASPTEPKGMAMLTDARRSWIKADNLVRRAQTLFLVTQQLENTPQPWQKKTMLGPKEREEKERWKADIKARYKEVEDIKQEAEDWREEGNFLKRSSKNLMSRMELSDYVVNNIKIKILASRHKESLLERMDMETIKVALIGETTHETLSSTDMEVIRASIQKEKPLVTNSLSLDEVVDLEAMRQDYTFTRMFSKKLSLLEEDSKVPNKRKVRAINSAHASQTMPIKYKNYLSEFHRTFENISGRFEEADRSRTPMSPSLISLVSDDSKTIASIASNNSLNTLNLGSTSGSLIKTAIKVDKVDKIEDRKVPGKLDDRKIPGKPKEKKNKRVSD